MRVRRSEPCTTVVGDVDIVTETRKDLAQQGRNIGVIFHHEHVRQEASFLRNHTDTAALLSRYTRASDATVRCTS